jgi:hypothetical protein
MKWLILGRMATKNPTKNKDWSLKGEQDPEDEARSPHEHRLPEAVGQVRPGAHLMNQFSIVHNL